MVVIIEIDQLAELQMTGERCGLRGDARHQIAVADDPVGEMSDDLEARTIVPGRKMSRGEREAHSVAKALTERTGGHFHAWRHAALRVARCDAAPFAKPLDLLQRQVIAGEV